MTMTEVVDFIDAYSDFISAPIHDDTTVTAVSRDENGYRVETDRGDWRCRGIVVASGENNCPKVPSLAEAIPSSIATYTAHDYANPDQLPEGGVLVVGASATGLQIADEIHRSGRPVTIAVGEHIRMPRTYRERDIQWWLDRAGILDERFDEVDDIVRARRVPSPQLIGSPERATLDLNVLTDGGVQTVGRLVGINDGKAQFSGSLRNHCQMADLKLTRLMNTLDEWAVKSGVSDDGNPPERREPTRAPGSPKVSLDLNSGQFSSLFWAIGFRPDYSWLNVPVLDRKGHIRHEGGVADSPGMYVIGLTFLRRRKSSFIHGAEDDARELTDHLASYLDRCSHQSAASH